jgi:hypothetical protein
MTEDVIVETPKEGGEQQTPSGDITITPEGGVMPEVPKVPETTRERVEGKYHELLARVTPTRSAPVNTDDDEHAAVLDAKHIGALTDEASKVQKLLDLAQTKGVIHAVKVARSLRDYYALDTLHDELSGKLYQGMLEKGLIAKE